VRRRSFIFGLHRRQPLIAIFFHTIHHDKAVRDPLPMTLSYLQASGAPDANRAQSRLGHAQLAVTAAPISIARRSGAPPSPAPMLDIAGSGKHWWDGISN